MTLLAKRYATALFDAAQDAQATEDVAKDIEALGAALADPRVRALALAPDVPARTRRQVLAELAEDRHPLTRSFLSVLQRRRRLAVLPDLHAEFRRLLLDARGEVDGVLQTARPLDEQSCRKLERKAEVLCGKKVLLTVVENPELIGGVRLRIGNTLYDSSVATAIEDLEKRLRTVPIP